MYRRIDNREMARYQPAYPTKGWVHIPNAVPQEHIEMLREVGLQLRYKMDDLAGTPAKRGPEFYTEGDHKIVPCASSLDDRLMEVYRSQYMYEIVSRLFPADKFYLFNDQIVYKLPNDNMGFIWHYDNQFGNAHQRGARTMNCMIIIDDINEENGGLLLQDRDNSKERSIFPKAGDIVIVDGNTYHASADNIGDTPRGLYACVYATKPLHFQNYYNEQF